MSVARHVRSHSRETIFPMAKQKQSVQALVAALRRMCWIAAARLKQAGWRPRELELEAVTLTNHGKLSGRMVLESTGTQCKN